MRILGVNTATNYTEIALIEGQKTVFQKSWLSHRDEASKIIPTIQSALKKTTKKLDGVLVVCGPGPFTGLRIGVTAANTLAYIQNIKMIGLDTYSYFFDSIESAKKKTTAVILRAGADFVAIKKSPKAKVKIVDVNELKVELKGLKYITGDLTTEQISTLKNDVFKSLKIKWLDKNELEDFAAIIKNTVASKPKMVKMVEPIYMRPAKVTQSKKELFV